MEDKEGEKTPVKSIRQTVLSSINNIDFPHIFAGSPKQVMMAAKRRCSDG